MAVVHDANTQTASFATASTQNTTHTPVGTPKGVAVLVAQDIGTEDQVTGITYGGVAMARLGKVDTSGGAAAGSVYTYFLGSGLSSGAQTVAITSSGTRAKRAVISTVTASSDTSADRYDEAVLNVANPSLPVFASHGVASVVYYCLFHNNDSLPSGTPPSSVQSGGTSQFGHDFTSEIALWSRKANSGGLTTMGWTLSGTQHYAHAAVSIVEGTAPARPYEDEVMADSPETYHGLDELADNVLYDRSGNAHHGSLPSVGGATRPTINQTGLITTESTAPAYTFDGGDIATPDAVTFANQAGGGAIETWAIECWVKDNGSAQGAYALSLGSSSDNDPLLGIRVANESAPRHWAATWQDAAASVTRNLVGSVLVADAAAHHIVFECDGTDLILYVDGVEEDRDTASNAAVTFNAARIGALGRASNSLFFTGTIDECALYDHDLGSTRVEDHFVAGGGTIGGGTQELVPDDFTEAEPTVFEPALEFGQPLLPGTLTGAISVTLYAPALLSRSELVPSGLVGFDEHVVMEPALVAASALVVASGAAGTATVLSPHLIVGSLLAVASGAVGNPIVRSPTLIPGQFLSPDNWTAPAATVRNPRLILGQPLRPGTPPAGASIVRNPTLIPGQFLHPDDWTKPPATVHNPALAHGQPLLPDDIAALAPATVHEPALAIAQPLHPGDPPDLDDATVFDPTLVRLEPPIIVPSVPSRTVTALRTAR